MTDSDARLDLERHKRTDLPEAIYCQHKTTGQCVAIVERVLGAGTDTLIATRATPEQREAMLALSPQAISPIEAGATTTALSTLTWRHRLPTGRRAIVLTGGTSDLPVATECRLTLEALGHRAEVISDVGVAGLHRLLDVLGDLEAAEVLVAVAGMEGALPTVLAGLVAQPLVAVPTSVGYGTAFEGQTALASMMTSCAPGIAVVGIDNGYGAACAVHRILRAVTVGPGR